MSKRDPSAPSMMWLFFSPRGRIGRQAYALSFLFWVAISAFSLTKLIIADHESNDTGAALWFLVTMALAAASAISMFFLSFKRLHDMGYPGPLALAAFVPAVSILAVLALIVWPSMVGPNQYGSFTDRPD